MGITAYEDAFKYKNIYKNIFTGINKEVTSASIFCMPA